MPEDWHFKVFQDGMVVAEGEGSEDAMIREAGHYCMMYGQDGPVHAVVALGPLPEPEPPSK